MEAAATEMDAFKKTEKAVKQLFKRRTLYSMKRAKHKLDPTDLDSSLACEKEWSDLVVDVLKPSSRVQEVPHSSPLPSSSSFRVFQISGAAEGFYFISNGLTLQEQLQWAQVALEKYSTAEHTNLENLKRLKQADCIFPKDVTEDQKRRLAEVFTTAQSEAKSEGVSQAQDRGADNQSLWCRSVLECNGLKSFQALRWASLGFTNLASFTLF